MKKAILSTLLITLLFPNSYALVCCLLPEGFEDVEIGMSTAKLIDIRPNINVSPFSRDIVDEKEGVKFPYHETIEDNDLFDSASYIFLKGKLKGVLFVGRIEEEEYYEYRRQLIEDAIILWGMDYEVKLIKVARKKGKDLLGPLIIWKEKGKYITISCTEDTAKYGTKVKYKPNERVKYVEKGLLSLNILSKDIYKSRIEKQEFKDVEDKEEIIKSVGLVTALVDIDYKKGYGRRNKTLGKIKKGDKLFVVDRRGTWFKVRISQDKVGWVYMKDIGLR